MKKALLRIFGVIFLVFAVAGFAAEVEDLANGDRQEVVFGFTMVVSMLAIGGFMLRAASINYRMSWALVFGTVLAFFGVAMLGMGSDEIIAGDTEEAAIGFVTSAIFSGAGVLLLRNGHRHHLRSRGMWIPNPMPGQVARMDADLIGSLRDDRQATSVGAHREDDWPSQKA